MTLTEIISLIADIYVIVTMTCVVAVVAYIWCADTQEIEKRLNKTE